MAPEGATVPTPKPRPDETLVKALERAHRWRRRIESGRAKSITDLAEQEGVTDAYETTMDIPIPGVSAIAAPVFDPSGTMELAITLIGSTPVINLEPRGPAVTRLLAFTEQLSEDLGYDRKPLRRSAS